MDSPLDGVFMRNYYWDFMKILPTFIEITAEDEVTLHAINKTKTGSKQLHLFASKKHLYKVGDVFFHGGDEYLIENVTNGSPYDA